MYYFKQVLSSVILRWCPYGSTHVCSSEDGEKWVFLSVFYGVKDDSCQRGASHSHVALLKEEMQVCT